MQDKIYELEITVSGIVRDIDDLKNQVAKMENIEKDLVQIKSTVVRMEMVDNNIFEKLTSIVDMVNSHKDNFVNHDKDEMIKYGKIETRLQKIEKLIYMAMGAFLLFETLHKFNIIL